MPSPVGHALGGLIVGLALQRVASVNGHPRSLAELRRASAHDNPAHSTYDRELLALCVIAACLPDIDFGWGRHNMETHSLAFALVVGIVTWAWKRSSRAAIACAIAAGTHVLFDWLGSDDSPPLGVMALWPFSGDFYFADAYVFATISRRYWLPGFIEHNAVAVLREVAILLPIVAAVFFLRRTPARST
jgi:membrane-bound metal-dependent hydrolase YbcI (DUF457 family)